MENQKKNISGGEREVMAVFCKPYFFLKEELVFPFLFSVLLYLIGNPKALHEVPFWFLLLY